MPEPERSIFGPVNYAVVFAYLVAMLVFGWWVSRRVKDTRGFFIAEGRLSPVLVGLSILGTYLSGLTMMGLPGVTFRDNVFRPAPLEPIQEYQWLWTVQLPFLILTAFVITRVVLPRYREAGVVSIYQFLEQRIHVSSRLLASLSFIVMSIGRMGLVLYLPALAFSTVTGASLTATIIVMGVVVTIYTVLGGIEAVIWTDAIQVVILALGALLTVGYVLYDVHITPGAHFMQIAREYDKFHTFDWRLDLTKALTVWFILETIFQTIRIYGTQQDIAQRYLTTDSTAKANRSVWIGVLGYIPLGYLFYFIGTALFVYYQAQPQPSAGMLRLAADGNWDAVYPYFVVSKLPAGIAGLVIAAIFAAAMSSMDSSMNSCSTVCVEDFYRRFGRQERSDAHNLKVARGLTIFWGALAVGMALLFMGISSAQVVWSKVMGISTNGVLALMALAFLPIRVHRWAAVGGFVISYGVLFYMMYGTSLCWLLWPVFGNITCFVVALLLNAILPKEHSGPAAAAGEAA